MNACSGMEFESLNQCVLPAKVSTATALRSDLDYRIPPASTGKHPRVLRKSRFNSSIMTLKFRRTLSSSQNTTIARARVEQQQKRHRKAATRHLGIRTFVGR